MLCLWCPLRPMCQPMSCSRAAYSISSRSRGAQAVQRSAAGRTVDAERATCSLCAWCQSQRRARSSTLRRRGSGTSPADRQLRQVPREVVQQDPLAQRRACTSGSACSSSRLNSSFTSSAPATIWSLRWSSRPGDGRRGPSTAVSSSSADELAQRPALDDRRGMSVADSVRSRRTSRQGSPACRWCRWRATGL